MLETAAAKINLYLRVVGRRDDGYHLLDSLAVFPAAADTLHAEPADTLTLSVTGRFAGPLSGETDNLVLRAARALAEATGVAPRARLTLEKNLPVASGIGGGSADAAAALRLLSRLWSVAPGADALTAIAAGLGADVPVCLGSHPARMRGIGEVLSPAPRLPQFGLALINPGIAVATAPVFSARRGPWSMAADLPESWPDAAAMARDLAALGNDLAAPAIELCPVIADVLAHLRARPGCLFAAMSGSGATCFGLFPTQAQADCGTVPDGWWQWS